MYCYHDTLTISNGGGALVGYYVECLSGNTVVPIYSDNAATPIVSASGVANRAKTDANGNFSFYVADGVYSLKYYDKNGVYTGTTEADVQMIGTDSYNAFTSGLSRALGVRTLTSTVRQVATNTNIQNNFNATNKQMMVRTKHTMRARGGVSSIRVGLANFYVPIGGIESGLGSTATFTAAIEYPAGIMTQCKFNGATSGTCADNSFILTDFADVSIPEGATFWVRYWSNSSAGIIFTSSATSGLNLQLGERLTYGVTTADLTMGGTIALADGGGTINRPCCIIGMSDTAVPILISDSRFWGSGDTAQLGVLGMGQSVLFDQLPYLSLASGGCRLTSYTTSSAGRANRMALAAYGTHGVMQLGINDVGNGASAATTQTNRQTVAGYLPSIPWWQTTLDPYSTSTDSWATTANQTPFGQEAARVAVNTWVRTLPTPFAGYFDIADALESARNSGKWKVSSDRGPFTADGLHANFAGRLEVARMQPVNIDVFRA